MKVANEQNRKMQKLIDTENSMVVTRGKWGGSSKGYRGDKW